MIKNKKKFKEHACQFLNEADCEESLNEDTIDIAEADKEYYKDSEEE